MIKLGKNQHVIKSDNVWKVKGEGNSRSSGNFKTQKDAIARARDLAKKAKSEVVIHGVNGKIRDRNSYGNDPYPPKG